MLNKIYTIWIGFLLVVMLVACGSNKTFEENADDKSSNKKTEDATASNKTKDKDADKSKGNEKSCVLDENHLGNFNEYIISGENWSRLLENRYFYVDGTKTYMPTTPREYQELFNTEFVEALQYSSNLGVHVFILVTKMETSVYWESGRMAWDCRKIKMNY